MSRFTYDKNSFYLDGKPFRVLSGAIHYFRIPNQYYYDRLSKLKECGFNTVETYIAWNMIEAEEGIFDFGGMFDLECFLDVARELGLYVIVRPGPYICAEWDLGGLPAWLLTKDVKLRTHDEKYLAYVRRYFEKLFALLRPRLLDNGGNIIMMQIENEYGSYGADKEYLQALKQMYHDLDMSVTLFTSDGPSEDMLSSGSLPGVLSTANFGSRAGEAFEMLRKFRSDEPLMCTEYWCGWFDHIGEKHHVRSAEDAANALDEILSLGGSVNIYVFCGGTNFNFMNGANYEQNIQPTVTSYDYDAPLDEQGRRTEKYYAFKRVLEKHFGPVEDLGCTDLPTAAYGTVELTRSCSMYDMLGSAVCTDKLLTAEESGFEYGYVLYSTEAPKGTLTISGVRDVASVFVNEELKCVVKRGEQKELLLKDFSIIDILVENQGRINYHHKNWGESRLYDPKGLVEPLRINGDEINSYSIFGFGKDMTLKADYEEGIIADVPVLMCGELNISKKPRDTFIRLDGFGRGAVFINGFCIGRYDKDGPQRALYVPATLLNIGENTVEVFETFGFDDPTVTFTNKIDLG